jgi:formamidopyrimidine-DNA glycosylase
VPELPDIVVYTEALARRTVGAEVRNLRIPSVSVLRTYDPPYTAALGRKVVEVRRLGKRIVFALDGDLFLVLHLMIAGRLQWKETIGAAVPKKVGLAAVDFSTGTLILTEQGTKRRAGMWILAGEEALAAEDRGGIEPLEASPEQFAAALRIENRTLKRTLTDPRLLSCFGKCFL